MENQERNGFGRTENQQKDFEKRVSAVIENLKGITRSEARNILNRAEYFLENDSILNKADWSNIIKGGLLYPEYPCSMVNHKNTIVDFIVYVITVDSSDEV